MTQLPCVTSNAICAGHSAIALACPKLIPRCTPLSLLLSLIWRQIGALISPTPSIRQRMITCASSLTPFQLLIHELETGTDRDEPPAKWSKQQHDSSSAPLRFLVTTSAAMPIHEFDRATLQRQDAEGNDALQWWSQHAGNYLLRAHVAQQYLSLPATSAQSERQFSAAGRLINKLCSRINPARVDAIIFLYKNMNMAYLVCCLMTD